MSRNGARAPEGTRAERPNLPYFYFVRLALRRSVVSRKPGVGGFTTLHSHPVHPVGPLHHAPKGGARVFRVAQRQKRSHSALDSPPTTSLKLSLNRGDRRRALHGVRELLSSIGGVDRVLASRVSGFHLTNHFVNGNVAPGQKVS